MKTFYIIIQDMYESDGSKIYRLKANTEQDAEEKFMEYICKIPISFECFTSFLRDSELYTYVISDIIDIE